MNILKDRSIYIITMRATLEVRVRSGCSQVEVKLDNTGMRKSFCYSGPR